MVLVSMVSTQNGIIWLHHIKAKGCAWQTYVQQWPDEEENSPSDLNLGKLSLLVNNPVAFDPPPRNKH